jgi:hypothetical protein
MYMSDPFWGSPNLQQGQRWPPRHSAETKDSWTHQKAPSWSVIKPLEICTFSNARQNCCILGRASLNPATHVSRLSVAAQGSHPMSCTQQQSPGSLDHPPARSEASHGWDETRGYTERDKGSAGYGAALLRTWCGVVRKKARSKYAALGHSLT